MVYEKGIPKMRWLENVGKNLRVLKGGRWSRKADNSGAWAIIIFKKRLRISEAR